MRYFRAALKCERNAHVFSRNARNESEFHETHLWSRARGILDSARARRIHHLLIPAVFLTPGRLCTSAARSISLDKHERNFCFRRRPLSCAPRPPKRARETLRAAPSSRRRYVAGTRANGGRERKFIRDLSELEFRLVHWAPARGRRRAEVMRRALLFVYAPGSRTRIFLCTHRSPVFPQEGGLNPVWIRYAGKFDRTNLLSQKREYFSYSRS